MNYLLLIRGDIAYVLILGYILFYSRYSGNYTKQKNIYRGFCATSLLHVILAMATEISVNSPNCPVILNNSLHYVFLATAVLAGYEYAKYILSLVYHNERGTRIILNVLKVLCIIPVVIMPFFKLNYLQGNGTKYSMGIGVAITFSVGYFIFLLSDIVLIIFHTKIDRVIVLNVLPMSLIAMACWTMQIFIAEFLFSAGTLTLVSISLFLAIENPIGKIYEAYRLADSANKAKTDFLSSMSHEIRTPINAILGLNEMILRESQEEEIKNYSYDIKSSTRTMLSLVNDLLDLSKIEAGKMELVPVEYDFSVVLNDIVNMIATRAADKKLSFVVNVDNTMPKHLYGDEIRVKQIMVNILTNAVKYTKEGHVTLNVGYTRSSDEEITLRVSVEDTGIGMKPESIEHLFTPFERIDEVSNRYIEGTGLGMSITQKFLSMMNSELKVESEYGKGSVFSFAIRQKATSWEEIGNYEESVKALKKSSASYKPAFVSPDAKVLVVDDTAINIKVFKGLLKMSQMTIDSAKSGLEAMELTKSNKYDAIFLDHLMPGLDGIETLAKMNESTEDINHDTPKIMMTANAMAGAKEEYLSKGFDDYLTKPIEPHLLEDMLCRYIKSK